MSETMTGDVAAARQVGRDQHAAGAHLDARHFADPDMEDERRRGWLLANHASPHSWASYRALGVAAPRLEAIAAQQRMARVMSESLRQADLNAEGQKFLAAVEARNAGTPAIAAVPRPLAPPPSEAAPTEGSAA